MQLRLIVLLLCLFVINGCARSETSQTATNTNVPQREQPSPALAASAAVPSPQQGTTAPQLKPKLDACAMLTSQEIQSIQGESLKDTKLSESSANGLHVSQCFFTLPTFTNSISLAITQSAAGAGARDPREFWKETFHSGKEPEEREKEEGEESKPPQQISGIGDEAFWTASRAAGVLYVPKGSSYIRISIGGHGDQQAEIRKSKALAQKVLDRL